MSLYHKSCGLESILCHSYHPDIVAKLWCKLDYCDFWDTFL